MSYFYNKNNPYIYLSSNIKKLKALHTLYHLSLEKTVTALYQNEY